MKLYGNLLVLTLAATVIAATGRSQAATITGWAVHNGSSTAGGAPSAPTFTPGDNLTLMAPFNDVALANDGDYVEVKTTLDMNDRTANTGANALNTQLRFGIFGGPAGAIVASDVPNLGYTIEYSNLVAGGLIREQENASQTNPFNSPTSRGNGSAPTGSIQGANPAPVTFTLRMTRNAGALDLTGSIISADYTGLYAFSPLNGVSSFNRIGLFLGDNVNATDVVLTDSMITTNVPEPSGWIFAVASICGGVAAGRGGRRAPLGSDA
ncbi:MAG: hypothetical protein IT424_05665 [Pirellulales bacterium]|nr:hypothetical protein [Pirellulales bacterium]